MAIDAYSILILLCSLVLLSYLYNYVAISTKIPSVLLLIGSGLGLKYATTLLDISFYPTKILLEILGISGLIFIVLEAALDLKLVREKRHLVTKAFFSAFVLLSVTSGLLAWLISFYFSTNYALALIHAIPLSVISSAIAIPSVQNSDEEKREFVVYESTFSDIFGIIGFNFVAQNFVLGDIQSTSQIASVFFGDLFIIALISTISTSSLLFLLNHSNSPVRFFLVFAILVLTYSLAKMFHLPSLILVFLFGLALSNYHLLNFSWIHRFFSFDKLQEVTREMKLMTRETAFIIRTFFFLIFGYVLNLNLLESIEVWIVGGIVIGITLLLRALFLQYIIRVKSAPLTFLAPRGLITILLFYQIPATHRLYQLSDGVLFVVIIVTSLIIPLGLLWKQKTLPSILPTSEEKKDNIDSPSELKKE